MPGSARQTEVELFVLHTSSKCVKGSILLVFPISMKVVETPYSAYSDPSKQHESIYRKKVSSRSSRRKSEDFVVDGSVWGS